MCVWRVPVQLLFVKFLFLVKCGELSSRCGLLIKVSSTNLHVKWGPSAEVTAYFDAPYITLHTGNRAAETTDGKPWKNPSQNLHFLFPKWAFYRRFAGSSVVLHISTSFSLLVLPAVESPSFSSAFCSLYYFWPLGRGYSHGDTDKAVRTLTRGSGLLTEGRCCVSIV